MLRRSPLTTIAFCALTLTLQQQQPWNAARAVKILAMQTVPGKSHWNVMSAVLRALTDRGHSVTVFTPFPDGERDNYTEVDTSVELPATVGMNSTYLIEHFGTMTAVMMAMANVTRSYCDVIFGHCRMREILQQRPTSVKFDVVIIEPLVSGCVAYAATKLHVPLIYVVPPPIITYLERTFFGHFPNPSAVQHVMSPRGVPKTFVERFANALQTVHCSLLLWHAERQLIKIDPRPYDRDDLVRPSITFTNTHFITEPPRPLTPDVVQIGGIHLTRPKGIPEDILEFIEDSPHGVIYFTFGSIAGMSTLPENVQIAFKDALSQVPQRVLWKYECEMKDKPKNVMTRKWFPQRDILLHPKLKLFIGHGGISGVYEAVDAGVPVLGFPIHYDQGRNIENLVDAGMAISMDLLSVTEDKFLNAVLKIINDEKYQKNAKIASKRFKDRPMSPAELVVYWTEYVSRHKGAPHLKSHAYNLTWYQYFLIDVIITVFLIVCVVLIIIFYGLKMVYKYSFKRIKHVKTKHE